ncbi:hypothetical protein L1987_38223 [Smallanthus sonchifolius]|uniref:Uncharacterized protein n=1 Tax=Smallanthus sonchifolius TaxID=185202 RepID=A0ACB9HJH9_9ASTR|nr:hypothetical protein L1987_38223 [Smallanthus sonchifolius]
MGSIKHFFFEETGAEIIFGLNALAGKTILANGSTYWTQTLIVKLMLLIQTGLELIRGSIIFDVFDNKGKYNYEAARARIAWLDGCFSEKTYEFSL